MINEIENIHEFLSVFSERYKESSKKSKDLEVLEKSILSQSECLYVLDFSMNEMSFKRGFKEFLGFEDDKIDLEKYLNRIHPQDIDLVSRIGKATILHTSNDPLENIDSVLYLSFRIQNEDGDYIKVLSQSSVFETDVDGNMVTSLVKVSDISFMEDNNLVKYNFVANNLDREAFKRKIYGESHNIFTSRELDIIKGINKRFSNEQISILLQISKHTVATHRKKIMKKSGCHSAEELILFCKKNGII